MRYDTPLSPFVGKRQRLFYDAPAITQLGQAGVIAFSGAVL